MEPDPEIQFTMRTLARVLKHERQRLETGYALREHIHQQLSVGQEPEHYRVEWLRDAVSKVIDTLMTIGSDFNRDHPDDKASTADLVDILSSTIATIRMHSR